MRQLSHPPEGGIGLELLVLPALRAGLGAHGSAAAFSRREAPGECARVGRVLCDPHDAQVGGHSYDAKSEVSLQAHSISHPQGKVTYQNI